MPSPRYFRVLYNFDAQGPQELSVKENEVVEVTGEPQDGWILASRNPNEKGFLPFGFLEVIQVPPTLTFNAFSANTDFGAFQNSNTMAASSTQTFSASTGPTRKVPVYPNLPPVKSDPSYAKTELHYQDCLKKYPASQPFNETLEKAEKSIEENKVQNLMLVSRLRRLGELIALQRSRFASIWASVRQAVNAVNPQLAPPDWQPKPKQSLPSQPQINSSTTFAPSATQTPQLSTHITNPKDSTEMETVEIVESPTMALDSVKKAMESLTIIEGAIRGIRDKFESCALSAIDGGAFERKEIENARKAYDEFLLQQMMKADGVDSCGSSTVREKRKAILADVEKLHSALDTLHHEEKTKLQAATSHSDMLFAEFGAIK
jgi:hypothetical protein